MAITTHFKVDSVPQINRDDIVGISHPKDFLYKGALGEGDGEFNDYCNACRVIEDADLSEDQMEAIAVLMNRAVAYGQKLAAN